MQGRSNSDFIPNSNEEKNIIPDHKWLNKKRKARLKIKDISTKHAGSWSRHENQIYIKFLEENIDDFRQQHLRRTRKVFHSLSKLLINRTSDQCRSHHQKLQLSANSDSPQHIIDHLKQKLKKKKEKGEIKTNPVQYNEIQEQGYTINSQSGKEIKVIFDLGKIGIW